MPIPGSIPVEELSSLARKLDAAARPTEVAAAAATTLDRQIGWDRCIIQLWNRRTGGMQVVMAAEKRGGRIAEIDKLADTPDTLGTDFLALCREPVLQSSADPGFVPEDALARQAQPPLLSFMSAPIGRHSPNPGRICLLRAEAGAYDKAALELLGTVAVFCSDALLRAEAEAAPAELAEENRLLRTLFDALPDYMYVKDADGRFVLGNLALVRSFGKTNAAEVIGKDDSDFAPPNLQAQYRADEIAVMTSGQPMIDREEVVVEASGQSVYVRTTKVPLRDAEGRIIGLVGIGHAPHAVMPPPPASFKRGTAAETAKRAKVSVATVSRAFSGSTLVTEDTRRRVFACAREVGYQPNVAARSLSRGRSESVSIVLSPAQFRGEFNVDLLSGLQAVIRRNGFNMMLSVVPEDSEPVSYVHNLVAAGACGAMAVHAGILRNASAESIATLPLPLVLFNYCHDAASGPPPLPCVGYNRREGVRQAIRHLAALGHVRIGLLGAMPGTREAVEVEEGFRSGMAEMKLDILEPWLVPCHFDSHSPAGIAGVHQLFSQAATRPTAVVCASDMIAAGAVMGARAWGQQAPADLSIVGFDDLSWAGVFSPALTTVSARGYELGIAAAQALIARLSRPEDPPEATVLAPRLIVRQSSAPPPPGAAG